MTTSLVNWAPSYRQNIVPMGEQRMMQVAPSVFATEKHASRTDRFGFQNTWDVVEALERAGFSAIDAMQSKTRIEGMAGYTKHMVVFVHAGDLGSNAEEVIRILLVNSHGGQSKYIIMIGVLVQACTNGLIVMRDKLAEVRVPHRVNAIKGVVEGTVALAETAESIMHNIADMKNTVIGDEERTALAAAGMISRFGMKFDEQGRPTKDVPFLPQQFLPRQYSNEQDNSVWSAMNSVQRIAIRGGIDPVDGLVVDGKNHRKMGELKNIPDVTRVNQDIWKAANSLLGR